MAAKLYYFHGRGKSVQSRWVLAAANIFLSNVCLSTADEFEALCSSGKLTYGQVPMLELDCGRCITQSMAIVRHAARVGSLYGASIDEASRIDEVLDGISDARGAIVGYPFGQAQEMCMRLAGAVKRFFPCFETLISRNGATAPFIVGAQLSVADVLIAELVSSTQEAFDMTFGVGTAKGQLAQFPQLLALHAHVVALPQMVDFMAGPNWFAFPAGTVGRDYVKNVQTVLSG